MVASFTQLLAKRYRGQIDADADRFIHFAVEGATRMQQMLNDLLAYSRAGRRAEPLVPSSSEAAFEAALSNLSLATAESGAVITHDPLPELTADAGQLTQLFQNLIANAVKFRREGAPRVHVRAERVAEEWVFAVSDNGIGIDPDYFDRIFLLFQRLHAKGDYPGTGIGLALCKRIAERHGGRIWVDSKPGAGATFYFSIPDARAAEGADAH